MTVYKYLLRTTDLQFIEIHEINRPLTVQLQRGEPCLWALVDSESPKIRVEIRTFGTGHEGIASGMEYVGTYQLVGGDLVFHVFIAGRERA